LLVCITCKLEEGSHDNNETMIGALSTYASTNY